MGVHMSGAGCPHPCKMPREASGLAWGCWQRRSRVQGAPRGAASPPVCHTLPTGCNVNNEPFIHPAAVTWPSSARRWPVHRTGGIAATREQRPSRGEVVWGWEQRRDTWRVGWRGSLMELIAEVCCQDAKWASDREIAWAGPGVREGQESW